MKKLLFIILIIMLTIGSSPLIWAAESITISATEVGGAEIIPGYVIGAGDVLDISVWKNSEMTKRVIVRPDGMISFPLIGDHVAEGKTVVELKKELENEITRYIPEPVLSVVVEQINSMYIYVIGKVNNPGKFELNNNINVLQALSMAGGLNSFAKRNKIRIQREGKDSTHIFEFSYDDVTKRGRMEQNIRLKRGDVIIVP